MKSWVRHRSTRDASLHHFHINIRTYRQAPRVKYLSLINCRAGDDRPPADALMWQIVHPTFDFRVLPPLFRRVYDDSVHCTAVTHDEMLLDIFAPSICTLVVYVRMSLPLSKTVSLEGCVLNNVIHYATKRRIIRD